jgi:Skp family chaperone for outer membrane proteins
MQAMAARLLAATLTAFAIFVGASPLAHAQAAAAQPAIIGILDVQRIVHDCSATQSAKVVLEKERSIFESQLNQQQNALQTAGQQLQQQQQSGALGLQDAQKRRVELQQKYEALKATAATRQKQLATMEDSALTQVLTALRQIVGEIAKARGMNLVIDKAAVKASTPAFDATNDITQEALLKLNARLPSIKVAVPK